MSNPFAVETVRCAGPGCEAVRRDCNHWFVIVTGEESPAFKCWPFDKIALMDQAKPVCGQACAQKLFEQFLSKKEERLNGR